jgi:hypothetical protein
MNCRSSFEAVRAVRFYMTGIKCGNCLGMNCAVV